MRSSSTLVRSTILKVSDKLAVDRVIGGVEGVERGRARAVQDLEHGYCAPVTRAFPSHCRSLLRRRTQNAAREEILTGAGS
jgi:hypothetical protein